MKDWGNSKHALRESGSRISVLIYQLDAIDTTQAGLIFSVT